MFENKRPVLIWLWTLGNAFISTVLEVPPHRGSHHPIATDASHSTPTIPPPAHTSCTSESFGPGNRPGISSGCRSRLRRWRFIRSSWSHRSRYFLRALTVWDFRRPIASAYSFACVSAVVGEGSGDDERGMCENERGKGADGLGVLGESTGRLVLGVKGGWWVPARW